MYCPAIFRIGAGIFTGAGRFSACEADLGTFEFRPALYGLGAVPAHGMPSAAYGDAVIVDGEIILVDGRSATFTVKIDERRDAIAAAVFVIRHGIMGRIQQEFVNICLGKELFHGVPVVKEPEGIMPGSGTEEGEYGQVIF